MENLHQIVIEGLRLYGYHGVHAQERAEGQHFTFDLTCDVKRTSHNDELQCTVDYVEVMDVVKKINSAHQFRLLESLAERIIERLFQNYATMSYIEICVRKHLRLTGVDVEKVAVRIRRARTDLE